MPKEKASKAKMFSRPFHGPFRLDTGVVVVPVHKPQEASIRVALDRICRCPEDIQTDVFLSGVWEEVHEAKKEGGSEEDSQQ